MTLAVEQATVRLVRLTECYGTNQEQLRDVWVNPAHVTRLHDYRLYGSGERATMIRFGAEDFIWVTETPEFVASELGWSA